MYTQLDAERVVETISRLESRIAERFSGRGLTRVAAELRKVAEQTRARVRHNRRPILWIRGLVVLIFATSAMFFAAMLGEIHELGEIHSMTEFVQVIEPSLGTFFFLSAFVVGLFTWEARVKRQRAYASLHELRSLVHVIDMHQLDKDPDQFSTEYRPTASSRRANLTPFEVGRYLDYCAELLSLLSKLAALHIQDHPDRELIQAVDEIEDLCMGLSRKIWQKIVLLQSRVGPNGSPLVP